MSKLDDARKALMFALADPHGSDAVWNATDMRWRFVPSARVDAALDALIAAARHPYRELASVIDGDGGHAQTNDADFDATCARIEAKASELIAAARERDPLDEPWEPTPVEFASPKVQAIYDKHLATAGFDAMHFGPAHIVWEDSNMERHHVQWCVDHFDERAAEGAKYADPEAPTATQLEAVRQSLLDLLALDDDDLYAYEDDSDE